MASIYDLSWGETSFLAKLQLFFKSLCRDGWRTCSINRNMRAAGYSALSSTYYTIAGTAAKKRDAIRKLEWFPRSLLMLSWGATWLPLGGWCYWRMLPLSNHVVKLIGYEGMTAKQCDIRQSILRAQKKYDEARICTRQALSRRPPLEMKSHTRALLCIGLADTWRHIEGDRQAVKKLVGDALVLAKEAEIRNFQQAARIYRHCANLIDYVEERNEPDPDDALRTKARELAKAAGAEDQLLKQKS